MLAGGRQARAGLARTAGGWSPVSKFLSGAFEAPLTDAYDAVDAAATRLLRVLAAIHDALA